MEQIIKISNHQETLQFLKFKKFWFRQVFHKCLLRLFIYCLNHSNKFKKTINLHKIKQSEIELLKYLKCHTDYCKK